MRLLIIRHGDPDYEHDTVTEKGAREVELLSERLVKEGITKIYCSPLGRARATAAPTCRKLGLEPTIFDWLQEFPAPAVIPPGEERLRCIWNIENGWKNRTKRTRLPVWCCLRQTRINSPKTYYTHCRATT